MRGKPSQEQLTALWQQHNAAWRDHADVVNHWQGPAEVDPALMRYSVRGTWWEALEATGATLLVSREYEHLLIAMRVSDGKPLLSYIVLPHPSGIAVDGEHKTVYVACTRNPNQILDLVPIHRLQSRPDVDPAEIESQGDPLACPLLPIRARFLPGYVYMHDLALIGGKLYANSVGQNAIIRIDPDGRWERVWWPRCIEQGSEPDFSRNYLQLNSIAAEKSIPHSFFSASTDKISSRRPGHKNFPVDRRGVIFSGASREPFVRGLTRPHSARLHDGRLWVDNSGYGELGVAEDGKFTPVVRLPGWTRGLCFDPDPEHHVAFVGTSRVLPRFTQYAPGLDLDKSVSGLHAVDTRTGQILGSLLWPYGNQIFALELVNFASGLPYTSDKDNKRASARTQQLFYGFDTGKNHQ